MAECVFDCPGVIVVITAWAMDAEGIAKQSGKTQGHERGQILIIRLKGQLLGIADTTL